MNDLALIAGPASEPITLAEAKLQLGFGPMQDSDRAASQILNDQIRRHIRGARRYCENYTRRPFITQRWLLKLDGFPGSDWNYNWEGYPAIEMPLPPTQSVDFVKYVDVSGAVQTLPLDTTYGNGGLQYGYQFARGGETAGARLLSGWARPWPPTRMVPANVLVQFRCGFGQPITCSMTAGSAVLTVSGGITFNPDDAPLMAGDTGLPIYVNRAGVGGIDLETFIAAVDGNGNATLAEAASSTVANMPGWAGVAVPEEIRNAVRLMVEFYYERAQGNLNLNLKDAAEDELGPWRNLVA